ncbi:MAG: tyrosine-type recombinase/integrase, partial [Oscillospiraceae bacterium]
MKHLQCSERTLTLKQWQYQYLKLSRTKTTRRFYITEQNICVSMLNLLALFPVRYFEEYKKKVKAKADDYIFAFDCKTLILHLNSEHAGTTIEIKVTPHQLRHAYATMLYKSGVDMLTVQYFWGHADINTTFSIYTH